MAYLTALDTHRKRIVSSTDVMGRLYQLEDRLLRDGKEFPHFENDYDEGRAFQASIDAADLREIIDDLKLLLNS